MGQKRRFATQFRKVLHEFSSVTTFVDLFGGSGLLSHIVKRERPNARVIYNDFDDFHVRIENVARTNRILADIRTMLADVPRGKRISHRKHEEIMELLRAAERTGFVDYLTISSSILFSGHYAANYEEMRREAFYNTVKREGYVCDGYLEGLEIVKSDYRKLASRYKDTSNVAFLVDPPYLSTEVGVYKNYWRLKDYLDVFQVLDGIPFIYFTSEKSNILELVEWLQMNFEQFNVFAGVKRRECRNMVNSNYSYTDIMLYKP